MKLKKLLKEKVINKYLNILLAKYLSVLGYSNIKVLKKGTSSTTEHDESRVILFVDENDVVVEEPKVG